MILQRTLCWTWLLLCSAYPNVFGRIGGDTIVCNCTISECCSAQVSPEVCEWVISQLGKKTDPLAPGRRRDFWLLSCSHHTDQVHPWVAARRLYIRGNHSSMYLVNKILKQCSAASITCDLWCKSPWQENIYAFLIWDRHRTACNRGDSCHEWPLLACQGSLDPRGALGVFSMLAMRSVTGVCRSETPHAAVTQAHIALWPTRGTGPCLLLKEGMDERKANTTLTQNLLYSESTNSTKAAHSWKTKYIYVHGLKAAAEATGSLTSSQTPLQGTAPPPAPPPSPQPRFSPAAAAASGGGERCGGSGPPGPGGGRPASGARRAAPSPALLQRGRAAPGARGAGLAEGVPQGQGQGESCQAPGCPSGMLSPSAPSAGSSGRRRESAEGASCRAQPAPPAETAVECVKQRLQGWGEKEGAHPSEQTGQE